MEDAMLSFFPNGIGTLLVDNDSGFIDSAFRVLLPLSFRVATSSTPEFALSLFNDGKLTGGVRVILADAKMVANCNFDFRATMERDFGVPVIYLASPDQMRAGDERLRRTLQAATYIIKKPLDAGELCGLWRVIAAWIARKHADGGGSSSSRVVQGSGSGSAQHPFLVGSSDDERDKKARVDSSKGRKGGRKSQKRLASNPGGSSSGSVFVSGSGQGSSAAVSGQHSNKAPETNFNGLEKHHAASHLQSQNYGGAKKAKNGGGGASISQQQLQAMQADLPASQHESRFLQAVLPAIHVPPHNPNIFADAAGLSSTNTSTMAPAPAPAPQQLIAGNVFSFSNVATFASGANAAAPAPAQAWPPSYQQHQQQAMGNVSGTNTAFPAGNVVYQPQQYAGGNVYRNISFAGGNGHAPAPAPSTPRNVFSAAFLTANNAAAAALHPAYYQQQQQSAADNVAPPAATGATIANVAPPAATRRTMANVAPPAATRTTIATAVTDDHQLRLSLARQNMTFGPFPYQGPPPPPAMQQAMCASPMPWPVIGNIQPPFQQPPAGGDLYMGMASGTTIGEAAATPRAAAFGSSPAVHLTPTPSLNHGAAHDSYDLVAMAATYTMPHAAPVAPNNVGLISNQAAMAALDLDDGAGSLAAPQVGGMPTNMNAQAIAAPGNINGSFVGSGTAAEGVADFTGMVASDDNNVTWFSHDELKALGLDALMNGAHIDSQQGGAAAGDAAGTSLDNDGGVGSKDMNAPDDPWKIEDFFVEYPDDPLLSLNGTSD